MGKRENNYSKRVQLKYSERKIVLFRNNRGVFLTLDGQRKVRAGLEADGASDLIGWRTIEITPDMVGQKIAQFVAVEVKTSDGRASADQLKFLRNVNAAGGQGFLEKEGVDTTDTLL